MADAGATINGQKTYPAGKKKPAAPAAEVKPDGVSPTPATPQTQMQKAAEAFYPKAPA